MDEFDMSPLEHLKEAEQLLRVGSNPFPEHAQYRAALAMAHIELARTMAKAHRDTIMFGDLGHWTETEMRYAGD